MADPGALGLIETRGLVAALEAADAALKAARVQLIGIKKTVPALMTVQVTGETAAVRAAVDAGRAAAEKVGAVVSTHVIPRPDSAVRGMIGLEPARPPAAANTPSRPVQSASRPKRAAQPPARPKADRPAPRPATPATVSDLEAMTVRALRALARTREDLPIQGREIARANKAELLEAFRSLEG